MEHSHLIASAPTAERLRVMIAHYFYGSTIRIEGALVYNAKGWLRHYQVRQVKGRYRFERLPEDTPDPDSREFEGPYSGYAGMTREQYDAKYTDRENPAPGSNY